MIALPMPVQFPFHNVIVSSSSSLQSLQQHSTVHSTLSAAQHYSTVQHSVSAAHQYKTVCLQRSTQYAVQYSATLQCVLKHSTKLYVLGDF